MAEATSVVLDDQGKNDDVDSVPETKTDPALLANEETAANLVVEPPRANEVTAADPVEEPPIRKSGRTVKLTEKALQNLEEEKEKKGKKFDAAFDTWRRYAKTARKEIREYQPMTRLNELYAELETHLDTVVRWYQELRTLSAPAREIVAKVDTCTSISHELLEALQRRKLEDREEFEAADERKFTKFLKQAHPSVFGDSITEYGSQRSHSSKRSNTSQKGQAEAEKVTRQEERRALEEQQAQRHKLLEIKLQMEKEEMKLEKIRVQAAERMADIKFKYCEAEEESEKNSINMTQPLMNPSAKEFIPAQYPNLVQTTSHSLPGLTSATNQPPLMSDAAQIGQMFNLEMQRSRLPTPTPKLFEGNPLEFLEFKQSFKLLIESKGIPAEEKLYYLKQYLSGRAKGAVEGFFLGSTEEATYVLNT